MHDLWEEYRDSLEECILGYHAMPEKSKKVIAAFSTYLVVFDAAYAYNASFLPAKFDSFEKFCLYAKRRYALLQKISDQNLIDDLRKIYAEGFTLTDGIWEIVVTQRDRNLIAHLRETFWQEKMIPEAKRGEIKYCLEWAKANGQFCFVVTGNQAKAGFCADPIIYNDSSQGCDKLIRKLKEVL